MTTGLEQGPPQLEGLSIPVPSTDRAKVLTRIDAQHLVGADDDIWLHSLKCRCGSDIFRVLFADQNNPAWPVRPKSWIGTQHAEVECVSCNQRAVLFDNGRHGYDAVIVGDGASLPASYDQGVSALVDVVSCSCGKGEFSVVAGAIYDSDDDEQMPDQERRDAYGCFFADGFCAACGAVTEIVEAETA